MYILITQLIDYGKSILGGLIIRRLSIIGKITFWLGFLVFMCSSSILLGIFEYTSIVPNESIGMLYLMGGIILLLSSNYFKKNDS